MSPQLTRDRGLSDHPCDPYFECRSFHGYQSCFLGQLDLAVGECDHSAIALLVHMGGSFGGILIVIPSTRSSSIPTLDEVTASDGVPASNLCEPTELPSTRIEVSRAVDRATLEAAIDLIYLRLDLQQAIVNQYR